MMTAASHMPWLAEALAEIDRQGLRRGRSEVTRPAPGRIERDGRILLDFASNDYLGLAGDPELVAAAKAALDEAGVGSAASALVAGRSRWHVELERSIAEFEAADGAVLFPTGYAANVGTIGTLIGADDIVFCHRLNHASLVEGCRLSGATLRVFRSDRLDELKTHLAATSGYARRWIVTDGVFGMDGTVAPLGELCDLSDRYDAAVVVDEAHGTGVLGEHGRGASERCGVEDRIAVRIGTLSKAVGTLGGFVAGPCDLVDFLWNRARSHMFSTALPPAICAAATVAYRLIRERPESRERLGRLADHLRQSLRSAGLNVPGDPGVPIIPVVLGDPQTAVAAGAELDRRGIGVAVIRPPTVPRGTSRLRISLSAAHSEVEIEILAASLIDVCRPGAATENTSS